MSGSEQFAGVISQVQGLWESRLEHPQIFSGFMDLDVPSALVSMAQRAAASREFAGETISRARRQLALAEAMFVALEHDVAVEFDQQVSDQMRSMIANGTAWREREAAANLSVVDRRVEQRGMELRLRNARAQVRELDDVFSAWRDTEWALDRQVRLLALRHQLGEV